MTLTKPIADWRRDSYQSKAHSIMVRVRTATSSPHITWVDMEALHCSEQTVYRLMREGLLGYTQVTPTIRLVRRDEIDAYLDNRDVIGKLRKTPRLSSHLQVSLPTSARTPVNLESRKKGAR